MDPHSFNWWIDGLTFSGAVSSHLGASDRTLLTVIKKWGHGILTAVLTAAVGFMFQQYQAAKTEERALQAQLAEIKQSVAVNTERINQLFAYNLVQDQQHLQHDADITHRQDIQRDDISKLQVFVMEHASGDRREFERLRSR